MVLPTAELGRLFDLGIPDSLIRRTRGSRSVTSTWDYHETRWKGESYICTCAYGYLSVSRHDHAGSYLINGSRPWLSGPRQCRSCPLDMTRKLGAGGRI